MNIINFFKKNYLKISFYILLVLIPVLILLIFSNYNISELIIKFITCNSIYFLCLFSISYIKNKIINNILKIIFIIYYILNYISLIYLIITNTQLSIGIILEYNILDLLHGLWGILNVSLILIPIFIILFSYFFNKTFKFNNKTSKLKILILIFLVLLTNILILFDGDLLLSNLKYNNISEEYKENQIVFFPKNDFSTNSNENIFILQLESLNSLVVNKDYTPNFYKISENGVLIKNFYGNSVRTNRAQENILCGINGNLKRSYSYNPELIKNKCLPEILKENGYKTIAFRSDSLEFTNTGNFFKDIGFEEVHFKDIMYEEDIKQPWGYDDKIFYERIFEYLNKNYKDQNKLFIYVEVSSHHYPFNDNNFNQLIFNEPKDFNENYINSVYNQDSALKDFYKYYKNYTNNSNNSHLFIFGDHSWPIGINNNTMNEVGHYEDNFKTSLIVIPKKDSDYIQNGKIIDKRFSEVDLIPTIFSILNKNEYKNSFEPILKNEKLTKYDNCQMLIQYQNDVSINIVKYPKKYTYLLDLKKIHYLNLELDPYEKNEIILDENVELLDFLAQYGCERYLDYNNFYIETKLNINPIH